MLAGTKGKEGNSSGKMKGLPKANKDKKKGGAFRGFQGLVLAKGRLLFTMLPRGIFVLRFFRGEKGRVG